MSAAADDPRRAPARIAVVSTIGYSAFLAGPPLLGLLADVVGYRHALLAILVPALVGFALVGVTRPLAAAVARAVDPVDPAVVAGLTPVGAPRTTHPASAVASPARLSTRLGPPNASARIRWHGSAN